MRRIQIYPAKEKLVYIQHFSTSIRDTRTSSKRSPYAKGDILRQLYMFIYSVHIVSNAIVGSIRTGSMIFLIEAMTYTVRTLVATVITTYWFLKRDSIYRIAKDLRTFEGVQPDDLLEKASTRYKYLRLSALLYFCLLVAATALFFVLEPVQKYFDKFFYGIIVQDVGISNISAILIGLAEWNTYNVIATATPFLIARYLLLCDYLRIQMLDFRAYQRSAVESGTVTAEKFRKMQYRCTCLMDMERRLDVLFAPAVLLWVGDYLANIVLPIRTLISGTASFTVATVTSFSIEAIYSVCFFVIFSFSLAQVDREYKDLDEEMFKVRNAVPVDDWQLCQQAILLQSAITTSRFTQTGWGLFEVDRSFILTVFGAVATYTVVLTQLTPEEETY